MKVKGERAGIAETRRSVVNADQGGSLVPRRSRGEENPPPRTPRY